MHLSEKLYSIIFLIENILQVYWKKDIRSEETFLASSRYVQDCLPPRMIYRWIMDHPVLEFHFKFANLSLSLARFALYLSIYLSIVLSKSTFIRRLLGFISISVCLSVSPSIDLFPFQDSILIEFQSGAYQDFLLYKLYILLAKG